jgi:hypothetical protein
MRFTYYSNKNNSSSNSTCSLSHQSQICHMLRASLLRRIQSKHVAIVAGGSGYLFKAACSTSDA